MNTECRLICPECGLVWPDDTDVSCCDCVYEIDRMETIVVEASEISPAYFVDIAAIAAAAKVFDDGSWNQPKAQSPEQIKQEGGRRASRAERRKEGK